MKNIKAQLSMLSEDEMQLIHGQSLRILENIGVHIPNEEFLKMFKKARCLVDEHTQIVRFPSSLMQEFIDSLGTDMQYEPTVLEKMDAGISTEIFLIDYLSKRKRLGTLDDIKKGIKLLDAMNNFPVANAVVVPSDVPSDMSDLATYQCMYTYSKKPGGTYILNKDSAPFIIEMSECVGKKVSFLLDTVSPLKIAKETLDIAMIFYKQGMPITFCTMVTALGSAPVTLAGAMTVQNAEYLCGAFMLNMLGQSVGEYPGIVHPCDPSTLICSFGSPYIARSSVACVQMARFYGLTPHGNIALSDALMPDFQCGFEKAFSLMLGVCAGIKGIGGQGIVGADQGNSFEQIVLDNEWLDTYNYVIKGAEITEETIGYDAIERVVNGSSFLYEQHTMKYLRDEMWSSKMFKRKQWTGDMTTEKDNLLNRANARVEELTAGYQDMPVVLQPDIKRDIDRIMSKGAQYIKERR